MTPLKVGIIGYGKIGKIRHECVARHPNLELTGICDTDERRYQEAGVKEVFLL